MHFGFSRPSEKKSFENVDNDNNDNVIIIIIIIIISSSSSSCSRKVETVS